jgi:hypothetical protein
MVAAESGCSREVYETVVTMLYSLIGSKPCFFILHKHWLVPLSGLESDKYKLKELVSQSSLINMFKPSTSNRNTIQ